MILLYALVGTVVGSFLNVVVDRLPEGGSLLRPPSCCPQCGRRLTALDLVPVASYLALRGRCRTCGARIPVRVAVVEASCGILFAILWARFGPGITLVQYTVSTCFLLVILVIDIEHQWILDAVMLPAIAWGLLGVPALWLGQGQSLAHAAVTQDLMAAYSPWSFTLAQAGAISSIAGGLVALAILGLVHLAYREGMGSGDVTLAAFAGLITGFAGALFAVFGSFILGGVMAVVLLASGRAKRKTAVPFAPFLCITTFAMLLYGDTVVRWSLYR